MAVDNTVSLTQMIVFSTLLLLYPAHSFSAKYYVDGTAGSDTNDGSSTSPWKTIGYALTPGSEPTSGTDTIFIKYATYTEALDLSQEALGASPTDTISINIIGVAQNGNMPIIDGNGASYAITLVDFNGLIQGLEIIGSKHGIDIGGEVKMRRL